MRQQMSCEEYFHEVSLPTTVQVQRHKQTGFSYCRPRPLVKSRALMNIATMRKDYLTHTQSSYLLLLEPVSVQVGRLTDFE